MADYMDAAKVAKMIREVLKDGFPGQKFSVTTDKYAGGASIDVKWVDGPGENTVKGVVDRFAGATFDGMIDLKSYLPPMEYAGQSFHSGADYVFTDRTLSFPVLERVVRETVERHGETAAAGMPPVNADSYGGGWVDYAGYPWDATETLQRAVSDFRRHTAV